MTDIPEAAPATIDKLYDRIQLLEDAVEELSHSLERLEQEHKNELAALRSEMAAMQGYRDEQIARAIAQHETETLTERLAAAQRRHSILCAPGNWL